MFSNSYHITRPLVFQAGGYIEGYLVRSYYSKRKENKLYIESVLDFCQIQVNQISGNFACGENVGGQNSHHDHISYLVFLCYSRGREKNVTLSDLSKLYQWDSEVNIGGNESQCDFIR